MHRDLAREGLEAAYLADRPVPPAVSAGDLQRDDGLASRVQAQEA